MCFSSVYKKALEKNQQWLVYDQQREVYVKEVLARTLELEQQLNQANQALQQQHKEGDSAGKKNRAQSLQCSVGFGTRLLLRANPLLKIGRSHNVLRIIKAYFTQNKCSMWLK